MMGDGAGTLALTERRLLCPVCSRYLGTSYLSAQTAASVAKAKLHCGRCQKWRLCDLAPGEMQEG